MIKGRRWERKKLFCRYFSLSRLWFFFYWRGPDFFGSTKLKLPLLRSKSPPPRPPQRLKPYHHQRLLHQRQPRLRKLLTLSKSARQWRINTINRRKTLTSPSKTMTANTPREALFLKGKWAAAGGWPPRLGMIGSLSPMVTVRCCALISKVMTSPPAWSPNAGTRQLQL